MAGAGVRLFTAGSQLLASQVNTYLMDQVVCYFADSATRDASFGGAGEPSLSPGRIAYLFSDNKLYLYGNDNAWAEIGAQLDLLEVTTDKIDNEAVTAAKLASAVAGSGLSGGAGTALAVNVDGSTIEINSDTLRVGNPAAGTTSTGASGFGYMGLPQNATTTGSYSILAADAGKHIYSTATRTVTIPANSSIAMPIGSTLVFIAGSGATVTIAITSDTMYLAGPGTTGSRTLAPFGMATAVKITAASWIISGNGLT